MDQKNKDFSAEQAKRLAQTPEAQQLYAMLQRQHSQQLNEAMSQAAAGDYAAVQKTLAALMADPEAKAMLQKLKGSGNG